MIYEGMIFKANHNLFEVTIIYITIFLKFIVSLCLKIIKFFKRKYYIKNYYNRF